LQAKKGAGKDFEIPLFSFYLEIISGGIARANEQGMGGERLGTSGIWDMPSNTKVCIWCVEALGGGGEDK